MKSPKGTKAEKASQFWITKQNLSAQKVLAHHTDFCCNQVTEPVKPLHVGFKIPSLLLISVAALQTELK